MNYHDLYECDFNNGKGARVTLFVSGCTHGCKGCYNVETWNPKSGKPFTTEVEDHIINLLKDEKINRKGLSLSGGDPLHEDNLVAIANLIGRVRTECPDKDIWMWTGYTLEELEKEENRTMRFRHGIVKACDVLIDGKFEQDKYKANLRWKGSENQIIHNFSNIEV